MGKHGYTKPLPMRPEEINKARTSPYARPTPVKTKTSFFKTPELQQIEVKKHKKLPGKPLVLAEDASKQKVQPINPTVVPFEENVKGTGKMPRRGPWTNVAAVAGLGAFIVAGGISMHAQNTPVKEPTSITRTASDIKRPGLDKLALLMPPKSGAGPQSDGGVVTIPSSRGNWRERIDPDTGLALGAIAGKLPKISVSEQEQLDAKTKEFHKIYNPNYTPSMWENGYFANQVKVPRPEGDSLVAADVGLGSFDDAGKVVVTNCAWISFLDKNGERTSRQVSLLPVLQLYELITGQKAKVVKILADPGSDEQGPYVGFFFCPDESLNSKFRPDLPSLYVIYQKGVVYAIDVNYANKFIFMSE
ncbi:MAG: hypothetical protein PHS02_00605 [Candidatus ainarchaeum sp.]|nr:hypothetical protein [Candidatus ainarchaeum sp.]